jgi:hypothetical protein
MYLESTQLKTCMKLLYHTFITSAKEQLWSTQEAHAFLLLLVINTSTVVLNKLGM